jgi:hypothetical protein
LQALTAIQQNNLASQPPPARVPITLTVCVTPHPSTTSRQHFFHRTAPLYMKRRIFSAARFRVGDWQLVPVWTRQGLGDWRRLRGAGAAWGESELVELMQLPPEQSLVRQRRLVFGDERG